MHQEQPEKVSYTHEEYNLQPDRIKPFMHLQMAVGRREIELHPGMTDLEWIDAYAGAYRNFVDENPDLLDRFEKISHLEGREKEKELELLVDEVRKQLSH
jgi:hypothetical protein